MPITLIQPAPGQRIGPGVEVFVNLGGGPIPNDDYVAVAILESTTFDTMVTGDAITHGSLTPSVTVGFSEKGMKYFNVRGIVDGAAVRMIATQYHANGVVVQATTFSGFLWDAVSGAWNVAARSGGLSAAILAAVKKTF